jgi:hypothetical protein
MAQHIARLALVGAVLLLPMGSTSAHDEHEIPDTFTNLKVLPRDIPKQQMRDLMKSFGRSLGVECEHCHTAKTPGAHDLDFASDEKETKKVARVMIHMMNDINVKVRSVSEDARITCWTCHRGEEAPAPIPPPAPEKPAAKTPARPGAKPKPPTP